MDFTDPELDPRLAGLYDDANRSTEDFDFFRRVLGEHPGASVLDLGCGTGTFTTALARDGFVVTGVDPNPAFLAIAAAKPGADRVTWIRGTSADAPDKSFDVAMMTSHVAQVFLSDEEWGAVLADLKRALVPGGLLAFDTRDPSAEAWKHWASTDRYALDDGTVLDSASTIAYRDDVAWGDYVYTVSDGSLPPAAVLAAPHPGTTWARSTWGYRFRSPELVTATLEKAGFVVEQLYGGWHEEPVGEGCGEIVVVATA